MRFPTLLVGVLCQVLSSASLLSAEERVWLELASPANDEVVERPVPLVEVRGRALADPGTPYDVVVAVDVSESVLLPSGSDVDGDGIVGTMTPRGRRRSQLYKRWTTDADDTVFAAEVVAARRLIAGLDPERVRVSVLSFAGRPRRRGDLGSPQEAARRLGKLRQRRDRTGTDIGAAIRSGVRVLKRGSSEQDGRQRVLVLLSDGSPTVPHSPWTDRRLALRAARRAAKEGVRIFGLTLGPVPIEGEALLRELARLTGGGMVALSTPGDSLPELGPVTPEALARVAIRNRTLGVAGRAVRLFPDGSFDGLVVLAPGKNVLSIRGQTAGGSELAAERTVYYEAGGSATAALEAMRLRTLETELATRARLGSLYERTLTLAVD